MSRIDEIRAALGVLGADVFYVSHIPNIRYLTGFSGSSATVIISKTKNYFVSDFRYQKQAAEQVKGFELSFNYLTAEEIKKIFDAERVGSAAFEPTHITVNQLEKLQTALAGVKFIPAAEQLEKLTMRKSGNEIDEIRKAVEISDMAFEKILSIIRPGMTEKEVALEITYWHRKLGADKDAFDTIVASGWRGALPHGIASDKIIENGDMVTIDFGCVHNGFCSDVTRTVAVGNPPDELKRIYQVVLDSQLRAIESAKSGITTKALDNVSRDYIKSKGYGEKFGHGLGHGLGIEVHELPSVSQRMDLSIPDGVVVTIEPGIYVDGLGGVRIEDDVVIRNGSCEVLNKAEKKLIIL